MEACTSIYFLLIFNTLPRFGSTKCKKVNPSLRYLLICAKNSRFTPLALNLISASSDFTNSRKKVLRGCSAKSITDFAYTLCHVLRRRRAEMHEGADVPAAAGRGAPRAPGSVHGGVQASRGRPAGGSRCGERRKVAPRTTPTNNTLAQGTN
jgi:hypothetical protein